MKKTMEVERINAKYLEIDPLTKRKGYDPKILEMLVEDIAEHGFKDEHPLVVRPHKKKRGHWLITCGQHRFEAGIKAGVANFPCVKKEELNDVDAIAGAYKDNTLSCRVDAVTEAEYFASLALRMLKERGHTDSSIESLKRKYPIERIALKMGVKKKYVEHRLKLLELPNLVQWMVKRYYMPSERGYKLSPTIAEELYRIQYALGMRKNANPVNGINVEKAINALAVKFWRDKVTLHEARKIGAEIAYLGYKKWKSRKVVVDEKGVRCAICGSKIPNGDYPWIPLCIEHKHEVLGVNTVNGTKLSPNVPLHEKEPHVHKPRVNTPVDGTKVNPVNGTKKLPFTNIYSKEKKRKQGSRT